MRISVCIATYNGEKYIDEQLKSILCQLSDEDEVIISDDASTDGTLDVIQRINDSRVKILHHQKNCSYLKYRAASYYLAAENFENALNHAQGEYIFFADQDDIWAKDRIDKTLPLLQENDLVICNYSLINEKGEVTLEHVYKKDYISQSLIKNIIRTPFVGCCMAFKRQVLDICLPFPKKCVGHDYWMGCLLTHCGSRVVFVDEPLHYYRRHGSNVSTSTEKSQNPLYFKIQYRAVVLWKILGRACKVRLCKASKVKH